MNIMREISKYNFSSRNNNTIKYIVLHYTGNKGDTAKNNSTYFNGGNRNASAHYFIDDNYIYQVVEDNNAAWSVGDGKGLYGITNSNSISIEMCCAKDGQITEKTEANAVELVKYLMSKYNISVSNVVRHYDASRKICPNWSANNWNRWTSFKSKLTGSTINVTVATNKNNWITRLQEECNKQGYSNQKVDGIAGSNTLAGCPTLRRGATGNITKLLQERLVTLGYNTNGIDGIFGNGTFCGVREFQKTRGLSSDGVVGQNTWRKLLGL